jgi:nicotinamidase-related amidase
MSRRNPFPILDNPVPTFNLNVSNTVLLISDVQHLTADRSGGLAKIAKEKGVSTEFNEYFKLIDIMIININLLLKRCRELGVQIIFTRIASKTKDGQDMSLQNKARGIIIPCDSKESSFIENLVPEKGDIIINKTCDNPFNCSNLENTLRNLSVKYIILCGVRTPGYLNTTALDAADRGFCVIVVYDAVAGGIRERKEYLTGGIVRVRDTRSVLELLENLPTGSLT